MPRRAANVTQADIARAIRAVQNAGLPVMRVIVRADGVAVETVAGPADLKDHDSYEPVAESRPPVVL